MALATRRDCAWLGDASESMAKCLPVKIGSKGTRCLTVAAGHLRVGGPVLFFPLFSTSGVNLCSLSVTMCSL